MVVELAVSEGIEADLTALRGVHQAWECARECRAEQVCMA